MEILEQDKAVYSVGTVARMLDVSVATLRMYEREGLLLVEKGDSGQRRYSAADVERLRCIRKAITEERIGIAGIKRIHGLIPCWEIVHCSKDERSRCPGFIRHESGCWTHKHHENVCSLRDCKSCRVYTLSTDCGAVKQLIASASNASRLPHDPTTTGPTP
jgi:MerR family transcriptional regulator/heat shock protein HspR